jgi:hypothetical protein
MATGFDETTTTAISDDRQLTTDDKGLTFRA